MDVDGHESAGGGLAKLVFWYTVEAVQDVPAFPLVSAASREALPPVVSAVQVRTAQLSAWTSFADWGRLATVQLLPPLSVV